MKLTKIAAIVALASAGFTSTQAMAVEGLSANAAVTTNYLWRGQTQSDDGFAIQGGLDYAHKSGGYAGVWMSTVDYGDKFDYEFDWYVGYAGETAALTYDVGYIEYVYLEGFSNEDGLDFSELYGSVSFKELEALTVGLAIGVDSEGGAGFADDYYLSADYSFSIPASGFFKDVEYAAHVGTYQKDAGGSWSNIGVSASKQNFTLGLSKATKNSGDDGFLVYLSYGMDFDLSGLAKKFK
ncbi:hypothetical protein C2869_08675 [Saccharobesus litoralis]|uniref:Uncharacterized protein n=2 Tax=Saccharobesus litoralis TaxID=2172099 RepID=A0A2S0VQL0_9ALTE|nr:hypothetical protein C2869_08675 [Saccharobesus litoralis]